MTAIGIDTHEATLAACAVDDLGTWLAEAVFDNDPAGHAALLRWSESVAPGARIGLEGSAAYGAAAAPMVRSGHASLAGMTERSRARYSQADKTGGGAPGSV